MRQTEEKDAAIERKTRRSMMIDRRRASIILFSVQNDIRQQGLYRTTIMILVLVAIGGILTIISLESLFLPRGREEFRSLLLATHPDIELQTAKVGQKLSTPFEGNTIWLEAVSSDYLILKSTKGCPPCPLKGELTTHQLSWSAFPPGIDYGQFDINRVGLGPGMLYITAIRGTNTKDAEIEYAVLKE